MRKAVFILSPRSGERIDVLTRPLYENTQIAKMKFSSFPPRGGGFVPHIGRKAAGFFLCRSLTFQPYYVIIKCKKIAETQKIKETPKNELV